MILKIFFITKQVISILSDYTACINWILLPNILHLQQCFFTLISMYYVEKLFGIWQINDNDNFFITRIRYWLVIINIYNFWLMWLSFNNKNVMIINIFSMYIVFDCDVLLFLWIFFFVFFFCVNNITSNTNVTSITSSLLYFPNSMQKKHWNFEFLHFVIVLLCFLLV